MTSKDEEQAKKLGEIFQATFEGMLADKRYAVTFHRFLGAWHFRASYPDLAESLEMPEAGRDGLSLALYEALTNYYGDVLPEDPEPSRQGLQPYLLPMLSAACKQVVESEGLLTFWRTNGECADDETSLRRCICAALDRYWGRWSIGLISD